MIEDTATRFIQALVGTQAACTAFVKHWTALPSGGPCKSCGGRRLIAAGKGGYKCENGDAGIRLAGMDCVLTSST